MDQLTFDEKEVKKTADFVNFVYNRAQFDKMNCQDVIAMQGFLAHMSGLIKKMDAHILEIKRVIPAPKKGK